MEASQLYKFVTTLTCSNALQNYERRLHITMQGNGIDVILYRGGGDWALVSYVPIN